MSRRADGEADGPALTYLASTLRGEPVTAMYAPDTLIMPVSDAFSGTQLDTHNRYRNHYSFIQSLGEHSYDGAGHTPNVWPSKLGLPPTSLREYHFYGTPNLEESRVVTNGAVYTRFLDQNGTAS